MFIKRCKRGVNKGGNLTRVLESICFNFNANVGSSGQRVRVIKNFQLSKTHDHQTTGYWFNIIHIWQVTPKLYECDSTQSAETFVAKLNMSLAAKLTNTASVTPAPELISVDNIQISRGRGPLGFTKSDYTGGRLNLHVLSFIFGNHENIFVS